MIVIREGPWTLVLLAIVAACRGDLTDKNGLTQSAQQVIGREQKPSSSLIGQIELEIGADSGPPAYVFGNVASVIADTAGTIYVADRMADEVRVFSSTGDFRFSIGRSGSGPGELRAPCCLALLAEGELWVRDAGNGRLNAYRAGADSAVYLRTFRSVPGSRVLTMPIAAHPSGGLIDVRGTVDFATGAFLYERHHLDSRGRSVSVHKISPPKVAASVTSSSGPLRGGVFFPLFSPKHLLAHAPDGDWAEAMSSEYVIHWYNADDTIRLVLRREVALGPELTPDERLFAKRVLDDIAKRTGRGSSSKVPQRKPVLQGLKFDDDGHLWVLLTPPGRAPSVADVFDAKGVYVASVTWPSRVDVTGGWVSLDRVVGVTSDRFGVERIGVVRLGPALDSRRSGTAEAPRSPRAQDASAGRSTR